MAIVVFYPFLLLRASSRACFHTRSFSRKSYRYFYFYLIRSFFVQFSRCCSFKLLVGSSGLEPPTSRLSGVRSNRLSYEPAGSAGSRSAGLTWLIAKPCLPRPVAVPSLSRGACLDNPRAGPGSRQRQHRVCQRQPAAAGGDEEDRTPDPLLARQVLSQLSYTPV